MAIVILSVSESVFSTLSPTKTTLLYKVNNYHYSTVYYLCKFSSPQLLTKSPLIIIIRLSIPLWIFFTTTVDKKPHFIRQILWASDNVRKRVQKLYGDRNRKLFKHSKRLLIKRSSKLKDYEKERINAIMYISDEFRQAYYLKEAFYTVIDAQSREEAKRLMADWILSAQNSGIPEYTSCSNTLINWQTGILNSFDVPYSNGFTEGCNNKIKVIKRNAYGYRNFERFRKRILHAFSYKNDLALQGR